MPVMTELSSSSHLPQVFGQMNTAIGSLQMSLVTLRSAHPLLTTVSSQVKLRLHRPQVIGQMSRARREWHTSTEVTRFLQPSPASSSRQSPCSLCHRVLVVPMEAMLNLLLIQSVVVQQSSVQWGSG